MSNVRLSSADVSPWCKGTYRWLTISLAIIALGSAFRCWRPGERYLLPNGYVGWVRVTYGVSSAQHFPVEDGFRLVTVPNDGDVVTSDPPLYGESLKNEFYYVTSQGRRPAPAEGGGFSVPAGQGP